MNTKFFQKVSVSFSRFHEPKLRFHGTVTKLRFHGTIIFGQTIFDFLAATFHHFFYKIVSAQRNTHYILIVCKKIPATDFGL